MAKYPCYCVRDIKVGFEPAVLLDQNDATAKRGFEVQIKSSPIRKDNPGDFELYKVGMFDTESGSIDPCIPVFIMNGVNVSNEK